MNPTHTDTLSVAYPSHGFFRKKLQLGTPHMGNDAVPLQRRVVPIPYHSQRIGETVRLPPK